MAMPKHQHALCSEASTAAQDKTKYTYPENLNIFNSGAVAVVSMGFIRIACIGAFMYGAFYVLPSAIFDTNAPWWMLPTVSALACVPLLASGAFGGFVNHINVILPTSARRTRQDLLSWAAGAPAETHVQIKTMWFKPWPKTKTVRLGDLRRLPYSSLRLTNLEHIPSGARIDHQNAGWTGWLVRAVMGRYWVSRAQVKDRSRAPGVWDRMWEDIPLAGGKVDEIRRAQKAAYAISNRTSTSNTPRPAARGRAAAPPRPLRQEKHTQ
ncbi:uncharacterized protein LTR77_003714 [Saxophila tyrrhenica]|uniref:Uncharacterized protein n=1 Tax=Saxophila tyrrhenica TaxID=1690608 RepID=A0AAV9PIE5_9PEZI|nr:hypothetical protein LTR77_003714 [Saxophila tyrrhenica]